MNIFVKKIPFLALGLEAKPSKPCPKQDVTKVCHNVGKCKSPGLRFSKVHWADDLECLLMLPLQRHFWIGGCACMRVAKAAISPPPSAISSTVIIMSSSSKPEILLPNVKLLDMIDRALAKDASYSQPLTLEKSNHLAQ